MANDGGAIRVERYAEALCDDWSKVLRDAKNGIFQFERGYMDYHGDRFRDISLLAYVGDQPVALMPAAMSDDGLVTSHPGLTFGGVVFDRSLRSGQAMEIVSAMLDHLRRSGARRCLMKVLPQLFATYPSAELEYALWRRDFALCRRDLSSVLPLDESLGFNGDKMRGLKKAAKAGLVAANASVSAFHDLLHAVWQERHGVAPVHSKQELELLQSRFPARIRCRAAWRGDDLLAGALVFDYGHVWHTQYLASCARGRETGALDLVVSTLVEEARANGARFLSFGASTLDAGRTVNEGLLWQKESYGARAIVHDFYEGDL